MGRKRLGGQILLTPLSLKGLTISCSWNGTRQHFPNERFPLVRRTLRARSLRELWESGSGLHPRLEPGTDLPLLCELYLCSRNVENILECWKATNIK